jgi:hypothetical protein
VKLLQALADSTAVALENIQVYQELEHRVRSRTAQLEQALEQLRQAFRDSRHLGVHFAVAQPATVQSITYSPVDNDSCAP